MSNAPLFLLILLVMAGVVIVLALGVGSLGKDGKRANRLMRYRIAAQFVAVVLIMLFIALGGRGV